MKFSFFKYHGTGNDFVIIDDRNEHFPVLSDVIARICHRRFGVGADGLILLQEDSSADFKMVYFNSDGQQSTMCGNGGRCIAQFAHDLGVIDKHATFSAIDGLHDTTINDDDTVSLKMGNTKKVSSSRGDWFVDTGSPHHILQVSDVSKTDVFTKGRDIRLAYGHEGCNVNFVEVSKSSIIVRTYERGVEDETYSCGTGVTASAIAAHQLGWIKSENIAIETPGGKLHVTFSPSENGYENIWLIGPAQYVFKGELSI